MAGGLIGTPSGSEESRWHILALGSNDAWEDDDIVIAQINPSSGSPSGWLVAQVLKSDILGMSSAQEVSFPFKITCTGQEISVVTGSVNNLICDFTPADYEEDTWYVYVQVGGWTGLSPSSVSILVANSALASNDTFGYLLLGTVLIEETGTPPNATYTSTVTQLVGGSQWVDRFKCNSQSTATYYWSRI